MQRVPTSRRPTVRSKTSDENAPSTTTHSRKPSSTSGVVSKDNVQGVLPRTTKAGSLGAAAGAKMVAAGVKRSAFGDVSNKIKDGSSTNDGSKGGKDGASKPSTAQRPRSATITTSTSASSTLVNAVSARPRPPISKTNSSGTVLEQTHRQASSSHPTSTSSSSSSLANHTSSSRQAPPSSFPTKPIIQLDSAPLVELNEFYPSDEDTEMAGPLDGDVDDEEALRQQHEHHVDEISRGVFDEDGGEGFYSEDEDEEVDDPEDWVKLGQEDQEEVEAVLGEVRDNFQDEVDLWDTTMVAEYAEDIFAYMEELELKTMPNPRYMESQTEIEWSMRTTLIDWLLQVHLRYHMLPETLWIAVNIVDRFLSVRVVSLVKLQLVGVTAMFIAAKYEEILAPSVDEFVYMTENGYTKDEILKGERIVLQTLDFNVSSYCSPYSWMRRISKADDYDIQTRTLSKFLIEATLLDHRFLRAKPSMIAAIGMFLANRMLGKTWNESFVFYSSFTEAQLIPGAEFLIEQLAQPEFEQQYVSKKYASKKFLKASTFARDWARTHLALED